MKMSDIGVQSKRVTVYGVEYVVTLGTGEISFGASGGEAGFAYDADEIDELTGVSSYADFCERAAPDTDRDLAIALAARHQIRLVVPGACDPVLSDDEYALVQATATAMRQ
jgi:hypothetical protein